MRLERCRENATIAAKREVLLVEVSQILSTDIHLSQACASFRHEL